MRRFGDPSIVRFGDNPKVEGYSLVQLIYSSNICEHICPYDYEMVVDGQKINNAGSVYLDIFSCKDYDGNVVMTVIKKYFQYRNSKLKIIDRI